MASPGPNISLGSCCRCARVGPSHTQLKLPMGSPGPIISLEPLPMYWDGPIAYATAAADALGWAHHICNYSCRCTGVGPLYFWELLPMYLDGPIAYQLQLPTHWDGPISYATAAADALGWAHHICNYRCRCTGVGPLYFWEPLPMSLDGPITYQLQLPMHWDGPISYATAAADALEWAHHICNYSCICTGMGPSYA
jgi:hypothetical protein